MSAARVEVWRGGMLESEHEVLVAVADADGRLRASAGDAGRVVFARSAVKPIQAIPLVRDGGMETFDLTEAELALCCASHSGEPRHVELVAGILAKIGLEPDALACGPHLPFHTDSADALRREGSQPTRLHNNCSGKHAGMLALARLHGWPTADYHAASHPVQQRILEEVAHWAGVAGDAIATAIDGCGVVTYGLPLDRLAGAFGRLARAGRAAAKTAAEAESARRLEPSDRAACRIMTAVRSHPFELAGTGRLCSELLRVTDGRIVAKVGAEGVYCAAAPGAELGVALKALDGARRAAEPALLATLRAMGLLTEEEHAALGEFARPSITNTLDQAVGHVRAVIGLEAPHGSGG